MEKKRLIKIEKPDRAKETGNVKGSVGEREVRTDSGVK